MTKTQVPPVGLVVPCSSADLRFLNSNVPCIRISLDGDNWKVNEQQTGLLVFITEPSVLTFSSLQAVRITEVHHNTAKASACTP